MNLLWKAKSILAPLSRQDLDTDLEYAAAGMSGSTQHMSIVVKSQQAICRHCLEPLQTTFVNLGMSPLCESFVAPNNLDEMEPYYPLHVLICDNCLLVQLKEYVSPERIFF